MIEGEAWLRIGQDVGVVQPHHIWSLKVGKVVCLLFVSQVGNFHVEFGGADRCQEGGVGTGDADTIGCMGKNGKGY